MINVNKFDNLHIKIKTDDYHYIKNLRDYFSEYVEGYVFMPKFQSGVWNGKVCLFNMTNKTLPYGLLTDFIRFHKKNYPDVELTIDKDILNMFKSIGINVEYNLSLYPRDYQIDCIEACLNHTKGIIRSATASGKSLIISYIIKALLDNKLTNRNLIIAPNKTLIAQFYSDLLEYGFDKNMVGKVYSDSKEFDMPIVVATWQTLSRNHDKLEKYDCVLVDEVHGAKATEVSKILKMCPNAIYRYGFTGTLPSGQLDMWNVQSYIGPVLREYGTSELANKGYISKCNIIAINLEYNNEYDGNYNEVKDDIFTNPFRLQVINNIISEIDGNILILVGKVEKEGILLKKYL
jgi:superfamily II DNA or RNA helicase